MTAETTSRTAVRSAWNPHRRAAAGLGLVVAMLAALAVGCGPGPEARDGAWDGVVFRDLDGGTVDPFATNRAVVLVFLRTDCPVSNGYAPELRRLRDAFAARDVGFWMVYPRTDEPSEAIRRQLAEHRLEGPALRDGDASLAKAARVRVTPEVAVFDAARRLVYHGRIDDRFASFGVERASPTRRELAEVLEALTAGNPVTTPSVPGVGCAIPLSP